MGLGKLQALLEGRGRSASTRNSTAGRGRRLEDGICQLLFQIRMPRELSRSKTSTTTTVTLDIKYRNLLHVAISCFFTVVSHYLFSPSIKQVACEHRRCRRRRFRCSLAFRGQTSFFVNCLLMVLKPPSVGSPSFDSNDHKFHATSLLNGAALWALVQAYVAFVVVGVVGVIARRTFVEMKRRQSLLRQSPLLLVVILRKR